MMVMPFTQKNQKKVPVYPAGTLLPEIITIRFAGHRSGAESQCCPVLRCPVALIFSDFHAIAATPAWLSTFRLSQRWNSGALTAVGVQRLPPVIQSATPKIDPTPFAACVLLWCCERCE